ncbi:MAG: Zn-dependent hydrolase, partial [Bacteroidales bacterium]|nr:Zn-dependent hydrolase [Bacteroidales bacterium]
SESDLQVLGLFRQAGEVVDNLYWQQTFGDRSVFSGIKDPEMRRYIAINYGPWDRLADNAPFVEGYGEKPLGAAYYPSDMTAEEFEALEDTLKTSLYTVIRRNAAGQLESVWYHDAYKNDVEGICSNLEAAAGVTENRSLRNYLLRRVEALRTDDYFDSDTTWMEMKDSPIDIVIGPIENYDDALYEYKAAYECFILLKDEERSAELQKFISMLPDFQQSLPCEPEYKTYVPGTSSDLNVYDAIYYSGDANAGGKTIAINLPNDDRVQELKGSRRLQLYNVMNAKFENILLPIGKTLLDKTQQKHLKAEAFFWNTTFHEVSHGLGVKQTINDRGSVDDAMGNESTTWEEAKADVLGLYLVCRLIDMGEIEGITREDAVTTFIMDLIRSVRFGAADSHGRANMMCYNYFEEAGAFTRSAKGVYHVHFDKAQEAIDGWAALILQTQATGDYDFAKEYSSTNATISEELMGDIARVNSSGIPSDIIFEYNW